MWKNAKWGARDSVYSVSGSGILRFILKNCCQGSGLALKAEYFLKHPPFLLRSGGVWAGSSAYWAKKARRKSSITPHSTYRASACPLQCVYNSLRLEWKLGACNWGQKLTSRGLVWNDWLVWTPIVLPELMDFSRAQTGPSRIASLFLAILLLSAAFLHNSFFSCLQFFSLLVDQIIQLVECL